jgi:hypothetical protein
MEILVCIFPVLVASYLPVGLSGSKELSNVLLSVPIGRNMIKRPSLRTRMIASNTLSAPIGGQARWL